MPKEKKSSSSSSNCISNHPLSLYKISSKRRVAIQGVAQEFLRFALAEKCVTHSDILSRNNRISAFIENVGGSFGTGDILNLFYLLEDIACKTINEVAALAQTTDPDYAKELLPILPDQLVDNVKLSRKDATQKAFSSRAKSGAAAKEKNRPQEEKAKKIKVLQEWQKWQESPHLYRNDSDFTEMVSRLNPDLSYSTIYKKWIPSWKRKYASKPLS